TVGPALTVDRGPAVDQGVLRGGEYVHTGRGVGVDHVDHPLDLGDPQAARIGEGPHQADPLDVAVVVAGGGARGALTGVQQTLAQVVLDVPTGTSVAADSSEIFIRSPPPVPLGGSAVWRPMLSRALTEQALTGDAPPSTLESTTF